MTGVHIRKDTHRQREERRSFENGGTDWSDATTNQGTPRSVSNHAK